jgi:hypothetical protein
MDSRLSHDCQYCSNLGSLNLIEACLIDLNSKEELALDEDETSIDLMT